MFQKLLLRRKKTVSACQHEFWELPARTMGGYMVKEGSMLRVIDAASNRACEALRVVEDYVRFLEDDPFLVEKLKTLRHRMVQNVLKFSMAERLVYRETLADVGTQITTATEFCRSSISAVLDANFSRLQEALRSLEEFSKLTKPEVAYEFEQIRYLSYTIQRVVFFTFLVDSPRHKTLRSIVTSQRLENVSCNMQCEVWKLGELCFTTVESKMKDVDGIVVSEYTRVRLLRSLAGLETLIGCIVTSVATAEEALLEGIDFLVTSEEALAMLLRQKTRLPVIVGNMR